MINWLEIFGGAVGTGNIRDVYFIGSPKNNFRGFDLTTPHNQNHGRGIGFEVIQNYNLKIHVSLVGIVVNENNNFYNWDEYFPYNGTYDWFLKIQISKNNQQTWEDLIIEQIASHSGNPPAGLGNRWNETKIEKLYNIVFPENTTHVKISIYERDRTNFSLDPIFPIEIIIPKIKPWAIRISNIFKSFNTVNKTLKIRKNGTYVEKIENSQNKIRKNNTWIEQKKIGE